MKQHTTQTQTLHVPGQGNLLAIADRLVIAASAGGDRLVTWEGDQLTVDGENVSWHMSTAETAELEGVSKVELTIFADGEVYKTKTSKMEIEKSVWDNGESDD